MPSRLFPRLWLLLGLTCLVCAPVWAEEEPTISLVKTIVVREYKGLEVQADEYTVQPGDYLVKVLLERGVIDRLEAPPEVLKLVRFLNPDLEDPNLILPGRKLVLPVGPVEGLVPEAEEAPARLAAADTPHTTHVVRAGERLALLLRRQGVPDRLIFNEYINLTMALNPRLRDPNLIFTGQKMKLPLYEPGAETALMALAAPRQKPPRPAEPGATKLPPAPPPGRKAEEPSAKAVPQPPVPPAQSLATRAALSLIFTRLGERFIATGQHFLPLKSGGQITINTPSFPLIELRSGHRIVLDLDRRLPEEMVRLIRANWPNYTIYRRPPGLSLSGLLDDLFAACHYYKIREPGSSWILHREIKTRITADWIIFPRREDWATGRAVVINLPGSRLRGTAPEAAAYLARQGVTVIDFYPKGNVIGPEPEAGPVPEDFKVETLTPGSLKEFVQALLDLVGQNFEADLSIPLIKNAGSGQDFKFTLQVPLYFNRNGTNYVVVFGELSDELKSLLEGEGFHLISVDPEEKAAALAARLLQELGLKPETDPTIKASTRPADRNIEFILPGLVVQTDQGRLVLTPASLPRELLPLLSRQNLRLVNYQLRTAG